MAKGNRGFSEHLTSGLNESTEFEEQSPSKAIMASRSETLARIATGKVVADKTEFVDPAKCRPWRLHNRDLDHLTEESCRDLIDAFLSAKKQRIPAIVRRLTDDPDHDYEIVAGVRRWWTVNWLRQHNHPEFDYLVTIQRIGDEEAFRVSDVENRSRKDITDWERAREYLRAMREFYNDSQAEMADHLNISRPWLSRLIDVARLPPEIVAAFADRHDVTVRIARDLKPLASSPQNRKAMEACALEIAEERRAGGKPLTGAETAKRLVQSTFKLTKGKAAKEAAKEISGKSGKPMLTYSVGSNGTLTVRILPKSGAGTGELMSAIEKLVGAR
jgi:ParB family chromosome partitioning protein